MTCEIYCIKVRTLSLGFYIGSSLIRALPHVYNVFRTWASAQGDLFSRVWDISIPRRGADPDAPVLSTAAQVHLPLFQDKEEDRKSVV